jgi:Fe-S-cluster containining protein
MSFPCRPGCAACCIAPSISSSIPAHPRGKPAGLPCRHLTEDLRCSLYGKPERPAVCSSLRPSVEMCGSSREEALAYLEMLERATSPGDDASGIETRYADRGEHFATGGR